jgi:hypothetical protein
MEIFDWPLEVAEEVAMFTGSCYTILMRDLGMHLISAIFVSRFLTAHLQNHLQRANDNENVLKNVITSDETTVIMLLLTPRMYYEFAPEGQTIRISIWQF